MWKLDFRLDLQPFFSFQHGGGGKPMVEMSSHLLNVHEENASSYKNKKMLQNAVILKLFVLTNDRNFIHFYSSENHLKNLFLILIIFDDSLKKHLRFLYIFNSKKCFHWEVPRTCRDSRLFKYSLMK
jgi:hypothetical protein